MAERRSVEDDAAALETQAHLLEIQGSDLAAVRGMERALLLRCRLSASDSETIAAAERLVIKCNTVAVKAFREDDFNLASTLLDNAMRLTVPSALPLSHDPELRMKLRGTTLNNYGCMERRRGRLQAALKLLLQALECSGQQSPATYVNVSAIQVQLGLYSEGVGNARRAIGLLERGGADVSLRAVAFHNLAMGLEHVDATASVPAYETALQAAKGQFGDNSPTTEAIERNLSRFLQRSKVSRPTTLPPLVEPVRADGGHPVAHPFAVAVAGTSLSSNPTDSALRRVAPPQQLATKRAPKRGATGSQPPNPEPPLPVPQQNEAPQLRPRPPPARSSGGRARLTALQSPRLENEAASKEKPSLPSKRDAKQRPVVTEQSQSDEDRRTATFVEKAKAEADDAAVALSKSDDIVAVLTARLAILLQAEEKFEHIFSEVVKIQTLYRCFAARQQAKRRRNERKMTERLQWLLLQSAARRIQLFFRKLVRLRRLLAAVETSQSLVHTAKNRSAGRIQRVARAWLARRVVRRMRDGRRRSSSAVRVLQCWARQALARATARRLRHAERREKCIIASLELQRKAARSIQKHWRALVGRRSIAARRTEAVARRERERLTCFVASCLTIQAWWRGILGRSRYRRLHSAEVVRRSTLRRVAVQKCAAVVLQRLARGVITRRRTTGPLSEARRRRAAELQSLYVRMCIRIQAWWKQVVASRKFSAVLSLSQDKKIRVRVEWLCRLVQRCGRAFCARRVVGGCFADHHINAGSDLSDPPTIGGGVLDSETAPLSAHFPFEAAGCRSETSANAVRCDGETSDPLVQSPNKSVEEHRANHGGSPCVANVLRADDGPTETVHAKPCDAITVAVSLEPERIGLAELVEKVTPSCEMPPTCSDVGVDQIDPVHGASDAAVSGIVHEPALAPSGDVVPPIRTRFTSHEATCGATIVRVARGWRSRAYVGAVKKIVASYVDDLVRHHEKDATGAGRQMSFDILRHFEQTRSFRRCASLTTS